MVPVYNYLRLMVTRIMVMLLYLSYNFNYKIGTNNVSHFYVPPSFQFMMGLPVITWVLHSINCEIVGDDIWTPSRTGIWSLSTSINGTGWSYGWDSVRIYHRSQFPWSAITSVVYPFARAVVITCCTQTSTALTCLYGIPSIPIWPTISPLAKFQANKISSSFL
jgi:hypothetical protein